MRWVGADPYINTDAGTMSPFEHGEVFVLDDGGEVSHRSQSRLGLWCRWWLRVMGMGVGSGRFGSGELRALPGRDSDTG